MKETKVSILGFGRANTARTVAYEAVPRYYPSCPIKPVLYQAFTLESDMEKAKAFGWQAVTNLDSVIKDSEAQYIDVCLPNSMHYDVVIKVLEAGKHVFCENPLAVSVREAREMVAAAEAKAELLNSVNFIYRRCPANVYARRLVQKKQFGKLLEARFFFNQSDRFNQGVIFSGTFFAEGCFTHRWGKTDALQNLGTHAFDLLYFITDMRPIELVALQTSRFEQPRRRNFGGWCFCARMGRETLYDDDATRIMYALPGGVIGTLECWGDAWGVENSFGYELYFENGAIRWNYDDVDYLNIYDATDSKRGWNRVLTNRKGFAYSSFTDGHMNGTCDFMVNALYENMLKIAGEPEIAPIATFRDAYEVERAIEVAQVSWKERSWVKLEDF